MEGEDVRWKQRFANFRSSVTNLREALETAEPNKLERQGIIKAFELCYELAWKMLQDYLREIGYVDVAGPKPVIRHAFEAGLIGDGEIWARMHRARKESTHVYNQDKAQELESEIREGYLEPLSRLAADFEGRL